MKLYSQEMSTLMQELHEAKEQCPLPDLMRHLRMGKYIQPLTNSPFRVDHNPSWGIYQNARGDFRFKDLGTGDGGDQIAFLAQLLHIDEQQNFVELVGIFTAIVAELNIDDDDGGDDSEVSEAIKLPRILPDKSKFKPGTPAQIKELAEVRGISVAGLQWAQERGVLIFGDWRGKAVYGVADKAGWLVEIRHLDGQVFPAYEKVKAHKSHALGHSDKSWPIGINEAGPFPCIALVEGLPDFLAAHDFILREQAAGGDISTVKCAPVGLLSANVKISEDALPLFAGKLVQIFSHGDQAGVDAAGRWRNQLIEAGARQVLHLDLTLVGKLTGGQVKDLNDLLRLIDTEALKNIPGLKKIMPCI
jgi:hypothetical protein